MERAFRQLVSDHSLFPPGSRILVAVSGGSDSVALLHLLATLGREGRLTLLAAHLDHGIRPEGPDEAEFVARTCRALEVKLIRGRTDVPARARRDREGLEAAARAERREFLLAAAAAEGCQRIALGHHRQDQVETVLFRLLRGSGASGLVAMRLQDGPWVRPLLPFSRERLRRYLRNLGAEWVEDPSNQDLSLERNRIRHRLLPLLEEINPRYQEHLLQFSDQLALEEDCWSQEVDGVLGKVLVRREEGLLLEVAPLAGLHPAMRLRVLRKALLLLRGGQGLGRSHLGALDQLVVGGPSQGELHLPGAWAGRRYGRLLLRKEPLQTPAPFELILEVPGRCRLPGGGEIEARLVDRPDACGSRSAAFDPEGLNFPLTVRSFRPGDRFRPQGGNGAKKLKAFFIDQRIEREVRAALPLVFGPELLWVAGVRRCAGFPPVAGRPVLQLRLRGGNLPAATSCL